MNGQLETINLPLNPYQAANLLWFLKRAWYYIEENPLTPPNNGDWAGEIPQLLEKLMKEAGGAFLTTKANGGAGRDPFQNPTWINSTTTGGHYKWACDHVHPKKVKGELITEPITGRKKYIMTCECGAVSTNGGQLW